MGKSLCVFFNRRYGNFLAKLNGVVNNTGKGINACGDTDNLNAEILNIDIDLVVPGAADDLAGGVVDLDISDISVVVGELYVLHAGSDGNAGKLIESVLNVAESTDRTADGTFELLSFGPSV